MTITNESYERIVQSAKVLAEFWEAETMSAADEERFKSALDQVKGDEGKALRIAAVKLLLGRSYLVSSDDPDFLENYRGLAKFMGASVTENDPRVKNHPVAHGRGKDRADLLLVPAKSSTASTTLAAT